MIYSPNSEWMPTNKSSNITNFVKKNLAYFNKHFVSEIKNERTEF